ncbi:Zn-dependent hydrolase [Aliihoeflea sp. 40Bstr573]|uniref:Zn-dependent hydrolase n=1 Tax=Aliihoeflea sp. 40Bstr573 TaxID=2696467 RepID=UPI0020949C17|nr:Zn-dependent hydrolase [Aliihoeflea sp. 40Bstr573]MCO6386468.1 hydantoinase/carbamoylase family amidase [Aliihoeflea sp. 40Bstr573]
MNDISALRHNRLAINEERLWSRHMEMARIGAIAGDGNRRLAMSAEDGEARALLAGWCEEAGLSMQVDRAGNMFAARAGRSGTRAPIASGSHLDTQPHGGRFDGISGVLAALEVMETLNDNEIVTDAPLALVNWTNEEGVRYSPGLLGSAWYAGLFGDDDLAGLRSIDGVLFDDEARARGWLGAPGGKFAMSAFLELHIEQGPILENEGHQVGIVTSVQGLSWLDVKVHGTDAHAGTTPLAMREDALLACAKMLVELNRIGLACGEAARVSVGRLTSATDGPSTVVGEAAFVIDIRHPDPATLDSLKQQCSEACREIAEGARCRIEVAERIFVPPTDFSPECLAALEDSALARGLRHRRITSGALHDAANVAKVVPTAMVFVPCRDGISHNVREYASPQDLAAGTNVLLDAMVALAGH